MLKYRPEKHPVWHPVNRKNGTRQTLDRGSFLSLDAEENVTMWAWSKLSDFADRSRDRGISPGDDRNNLVAFTMGKAAGREVLRVHDRMVEGFDALGETPEEGLTMEMIVEPLFLRWVFDHWAFRLHCQAEVSGKRNWAKRVHQATYTDEIKKVRQSIKAGRPIYMGMPISDKEEPYPPDSIDTMLMFHARVNALEEKNAKKPKGKKTTKKQVDIPPWRQPKRRLTDFAGWSAKGEEGTVADEESARRAKLRVAGERHSSRASFEG